MSIGEKSKLLNSSTLDYLFCVLVFLCLRSPGAVFVLPTPPPPPFPPRTVYFLHHTQKFDMSLQPTLIIISGMGYFVYGRSPVGNSPGRVVVFLHCVTWFAPYP